MKTFKSFESFDDNDDSSWYEKEGYIVHPDVKSKDDLIKLIEEGVQSAWDKFAENNYPLDECAMKLEISKGRNDKMYIEVKSSWDFTDNELGIFSRAFKRAQMGFFSGREISFSDPERTAGKFYFKRYIWTTLNLRFELMSGGTNGAGYILKDNHDRNDVWYDILNKKWMKIDDYKASLKP